MPKICTAPGCNNPVFNLKQMKCISHIQRKPIAKKPYKIAPRSAKLKQAHKEYTTVRKQYLTEHKTCEANLTGCKKHAEDIHHKKGRIGKLLTDTAHFIAVCRHCHHLIEENPVMAKEKGLSLSRLRDI